MVFSSSGSVDSPYLYIAFKLEGGREFRLVAKLEARVAELEGREA